MLTISKKCMFDIIVTIDKKNWDKICDELNRQYGVYEAIAFNAIKRIGSTYRKELCWLVYTTPAREMAIIDTLQVIGVKEFIRIKSNPPKKKIGFYVEYISGDLQEQRATLNIVGSKGF